jgi:hypothetical protein
MTNFQFAAYMFAVVLIIGMMLSAGVYLIVTEHYGWAWIPFLLVACIDMKYIRNDSKDDKKEETK